MMKAPAQILMEFLRSGTDPQELDSLPEETLAAVDRWLMRVLGEVAQRLERWELDRGDRVIVRLDDLSEVTMTTRSRPFMLNDHSPVIFLDGIRGCYALSRVRRTVPETK